MKRWIFISFLLFGCGGGNGQHKLVSDASQHPANAAGGVGYDRVRPIFAQYCSACHPSRSSPDWLDYAKAKPYVSNGKLMSRAVTQASMPPPGSPQAISIPDSARATIRAWVESGGAEQSTSSPSPQATVTTRPQNATITQCLQCHGTRAPGSEIQPRIPILAGQNAPYMRLQLNRFKWRERLDPTNAMNDVAAELSKAKIIEVSNYFANGSGLAEDKIPKLDEDQQEMFAEGKKMALANCVFCHLNAENGNRPSNDLLPVLAGQSRQYLINQLLYFRDDERRSPLMHEFARNLSNDQIEQLAIYFARSK